MFIFTKSTQQNTLMSDSIYEVGVTNHRFAEYINNS